MTEELFDEYELIAACEDIIGRVEDAFFEGLDFSNVAEEQ